MDIEKMPTVDTGGGELVSYNTKTTPEQKAVVTPEFITTGEIKSDNTSSVPPVINNASTTVDKANENLLKQQVNAQKENTKLGADLSTDYNTYVDATKKSAEDLKKSAENNADANAKIINQGDAELKALQDEQLKQAERNKNIQIDLLNEQKQSETDYLKAQQEATKLKNEQAINDAKIQVEIQRQQSAWAYNKLGLGMSSGIINQSQQIATQGIAKITELKINANLSNAEFAFKIADSEFKYNSMVNDAIDKYSNTMTNIKTEMTKRITETQKSLLENSYSKANKISEIETWARNELKNAKSTHIAEMQSVMQKGVEYAQSIQQTVTNMQNVGKQKINDRVTDGSLYSMSIPQLVKLAKDAGMTLDEIISLKKSSISQQTSKIASQIMGNDFVLGGVERNIVNTEVNRLIESGKTLEEASQIAVKRVLVNNPEYKKKQELENLKYKVDVKNLNKELTYKATTSSGKTTTVKGADMIRTVAEDGTLKFTNRLTGETITAYEAVPDMSKPFLNIGNNGKVTGVDYPTTKKEVKVNTKIYNNSSSSNSAIDQIFDGN